MAVSPKEFGQMIAEVKHLADSVNGVKVEVAGFHSRINEHAEKEENERKDMLGVMAANAEASQKRHDEHKKDFNDFKFELKSEMQKINIHLSNKIETDKTSEEKIKNIDSRLKRLEDFLLQGKIVYVLLCAIVCTVASAGGALFLILGKIAMQYYFPDSPITEAISFLYDSIPYYG